MPYVVILRSLQRIAELAAKSRLPSIVLTLNFAQDGALMAYGPTQRDMHRIAATLVAKILTYLPANTAQRAVRGEGAAVEEDPRLRDAVPADRRSPECCGRAERSRTSRRRCRTG